MKELNIGSLALKLNTRSPAEAKRLAERVASGLDRLSLSGPLPEAEKVVRVRVDATSGAAHEHLADRIIEEVIRQLERK